MSLRNIVDIIIQLDSFRNIDLCNRGLYYFQFRIVHEKDEAEVPASPYNCYTEETILPKHWNNSPGLIDDAVFKSKTFYVKYCDEDVNIKEIVAFRAEIEMTWTQPPDIIILCELMYLDAGENNEFLPENAATFVKEASSRIIIKKYIQGVNQFLPINFGQNHYCVLSSTIHVIPIDFRFRAKPLTDLDPSSQSTGINLFSTLSDFLFPGKALVNEEEVKIIQDRYVKMLNSVYQKNMKLINEWINYAENYNRMAGRRALLNRMQDASLKVDRIKDADPNVASQAILGKVQEAAENLNSLIFYLINTLLQIPSQVCSFMMLKYNKIMKDKLGESIFRTVTQADSFSCIGAGDSGKNHIKIAKKVRRSEYYRKVEPIPASIDFYFPCANSHPILFLDVVSKVSEQKLMWQDEWINYMSQSKKNHLIIFVHGFQGNSLDLRTFRNQVALICSNSILLCSSKNEDHSGDDILSMGKRLAAEIHQFVEDWCSIVKPCKISFIGHSLGGLIIRAALPFLKDLSQNFCFFMTLSTPHLGYSYNSSTLVGAGMWILKKLKKSQAMKELTMSDSKTMEQCFLYKLSNTEGLEWFKHIALVSSFQDAYAPYESARIEVGPEAAGDKKGKVMIEMGRNVLRRISAKKIYRIDVDYKIEKNGIDKLIGRAAHMQILDNAVAINMILHCCASFFEV